MAKNPFFKILIKKTENNLTEIIESFRFEESTEKDNLLEFTIGGVENADLLDGDELKRGNEILFSFGYLGGRSTETRTAIVKDVQCSYSNILKATIKCVDKGFTLKKQTSSRIWKGKTSSQIISDIADQFGFGKNIESTTKVHESLSQGNKNYSEFITHLTTLEPNNMIYFVSDNVMNFVKKDLKKAAERKFEFRYGGGIVKSFRTRFSQKASSESTEVKSNNIDPDTNIPIESKINDTNNDQKESLGAQTVSWDVNGLLKTTELDTQTITPKNILNIDDDTGKNVPAPQDKQVDIDIKNKKNHNKASEKELTATLTTEGEPTINVGSIITMSGVLKIHEGNWYVNKVTHSISTGGYTTSLGMDKNATKIKTNSTKGTSNDVPDKKNNKTIGADNETKDSKTLTRVNYDVNGNEISRS